jgi:hypothetical protein
MRYAKKMLALVLLATPILVVAQLASDQQIVARVPFEFMVANKYVPAGECIVQRAGMNSSVLVVRNFAAGKGAFSQTIPGGTKKAATNYALVFHKYGDLHVLAAVRIAGSRTTVELPKSKAEMELQAKNKVPTEEVLLASVR